MTGSARQSLVRGAGVALVLLAAGAAILPVAPHIPERLVIGLLLIAAGLIESVAVLARRGPRLTEAVAAGASLVAGLRLALDPTVNFLTVLNLVILWLVVRSAALLFSARRAQRPRCVWIYIAAGVDFLLALLLLAGLPVALLVYGLFGQTSRVLATFAWILAASFVAAGLFLVVAGPDDAGQSSG